MKKTQKQKSRQRLQEFLLSFFGDELEEEVREVNDFILTKNVNGVTGKSYVAIYTKESFDKRQSFLFSTRGIAEGERD